ncbi:hypothetical protein [Vibrio splendidus]|uniref:hypothetical protein n=1 Tax=Vibrio splendidus TaxID=29497 RepID=UPI0015E716A5|nr:hypothetical protein [Vibrio splendidus]
MADTKKKPSEHSIKHSKATRIKAEDDMYKMVGKVNRMWDDLTDMEHVPVTYSKGGWVW